MADVAALVLRRGQQPRMHVSPNGSLHDDKTCFFSRYIMKRLDEAKTAAPSVIAISPRVVVPYMQE
jgi:hypothetical protein